MPTAFEELLSLLDLEPIEVNIFRGISPKERSMRVFGGQVLGQALVAASRTVENRLCHSLHAYFILPGDPKVPILYEVDRSRDGGSFTTRRVVAIQHGRPIFSMAASFHNNEAGALMHQFPMPKVPEPETLPNEKDRRIELARRLPADQAAWMARERAIETRPVDPIDIINPQAHEPRQNVWVKAMGTLPDDPKLHQCLLAYASDMTLLETSLLPHAVGWYSNRVQLASLDHAMWFHLPFRADEWLLYSQDSPVAAGARGLSRGMVFTREGKLVASVVQEGLIRVVKPQSK